jgi:hypothetical protein
LIIEVCFVDADEPMMLRLTRFGRVEMLCKEDVVSVMEEARVRVVR